MSKIYADSYLCFPLEWESSLSVVLLLYYSATSVTFLQVEWSTTKSH